MTDKDFQSMVQGAIGDWNGNSSRSAQMVAFHVAAVKEFGLDPTSYRLTPNFQSTRQAAETLLKKNEDVYMVALRAMYDHTQAEFAKEGVTHVSLWRGYGFKDNAQHMPSEFKDYLIGDEFAAENQALPMQSWASNGTTARSFGASKAWGYVTKTRVPVTQIVGTGVTGFGTGTAEHEFIVLSGPGTVHHQVLNRPDNKKRTP